MIFLGGLALGVVVASLGFLALGSFIAGWESDPDYQDYRDGTNRPPMPPLGAEYRRPPMPDAQRRYGRNADTLEWRGE